MPVKYAVVDLETTGTKYNRGDRIIQIGVVFLEGQKKIGEFKSNIQPLIPVPKNISDLTGIQTEDLRDAPYLKRLLQTSFNNYKIVSLWPTILILIINFLVLPLKA